jgi:hypothetical protein
MLKYRCRLAAVRNLPFVSPFSILIELFVPRDPVTRARPKFTSIFFWRKFDLFRSIQFQRTSVQPRDRAVTRVCFIDCAGDSMACAADWLVLTLNATWYNLG